MPQKRSSLAALQKTSRGSSAGPDMEHVRRADGAVPSTSRPRVVVLTREAHRGGRWVTALAAALADRLRDVDAVVEIVCVERAAADASLLPAGGGRPQCALLVNRVSDAAPPATAKAAAALLHCMELHAIPVVNGARCFAIGNSKLLHQQVLSQAGCAVPRSVAVALEPGADRYQRRAALDSAASSLLAAGAAFPLLAKPNCGGFGEGVVPMRSLDDLLRWSHADDTCTVKKKTSCTNDTHTHTHTHTQVRRGRCGCGAVCRRRDTAAGFQA